MPEQLDNPLDGRGTPAACKASRWEAVDAGLDRIEVPGGWLYRSASIGAALAFVPRAYDEDLVLASVEMLAQLRACEVFIAGFEGDEAQDPPVDLLLKNIRATLAAAEGLDERMQPEISQEAAQAMLAALDDYVDVLEAIADEISVEFKHSARANSLRIIAKTQRAAIAAAEGRAP